jgi:hypothetical protein
MTKKNQTPLIPAVTHCATTDIAELVEYDRDDVSRPRRQDMEGFDATFIDIVDYILRVTYWIWNNKQVELYHEYYSKACVLHSLAEGGNIKIDCQAVVDNANDSKFFYSLCVLS